MCYWKQWKKTKTKYDNLVKLGIENPKHGNLQTHESHIGEYQIVQFYPKV